MMDDSRWIELVIRKEVNIMRDTGAVETDMILTVHQGRDIETMEVKVMVGIITELNQGTEIDLNPGIEMKQETEWEIEIETGKEMINMKIGIDLTETEIETGREDREMIDTQLGIAMTQKEIEKEATIDMKLGIGMTEIEIMMTQIDMVIETMTEETETGDKNERPGFLTFLIFQTLNIF